MYIIKKIGHMLKPLVPKFCSDLSVRLRDIAEKQVPAKLKPIVVWREPSGKETPGTEEDVGPR